ncbi:MAG: glycosyltransferase family 9 protein, partial [Candidatus Woesearchaeota archaeon]
MKILIIKLGALGDVLRTTFIARGLKEKYLGCIITWLTKENATDILQNNEYINTIITWNNHQELLYQEFDLVISLDDEQETCEFATKLKTKKLQGAYVDTHGNRIYTNDVEAWFSMGLLRPKEKGGKIKADELKKLNRKTFQEIYAKIFDINQCNTKPILNLTISDLKYSQQILDTYSINPHKKIIGINTGAASRWLLKSISIEKTAIICNELAKHATILILGGLDEIERNKKIKELCPNPNIISIEPTKKIREFASIINLCDLIITADTLALHISLALEKKTIAFFGPTSPWEIEMFGLGDKIFKQNECLCCYKQTSDTK